MFRLSQARARADLREEVTADDAEVGLYKYAYTCIHMNTQILYILLYVYNCQYTGQHKICMTTHLVISISIYYMHHVIPYIIVLLYTTLHYTTIHVTSSPR